MYYKWIWFWISIQHISWTWNLGIQWEISKPAWFVVFQKSSSHWCPVSRQLDNAHLYLPFCRLNFPIQMLQHCRKTYPRMLFVMCHSIPAFCFRHLWQPGSLCFIRLVCLYFSNFLLSCVCPECFVCLIFWCQGHRFNFVFLAFVKNKWVFSIPDLPCRFAWLQYSFD